MGFLVGCSGSGGTGSQTFAGAAASNTAGTSASLSTAPVPVNVSYAFSSGLLAGVVPASKSRRTAQANSGYTGFTSNASLPVTLTITVTPVGGASLPPVSGSCTVAASQTSGSCNVALSAPPGPETIAGTLTNGSSQAIASFTNVIVVQPNTINAINFTANPIVSSVALALAPPTTYNSLPATNAGVAANVSLSVNAMDAAGNIIAGNTPYVDATGNPVSFTLSVSNVQAGGNGTVTILGPSRVAAPAQGAIFAHYDGRWLQSSTISVASTSPLITTLTPVTLATKPTYYEYGVPVHPYSITAGSDGNMWFTESTAIVKMSTSGAMLNTYPNPNGNTYAGSYDSLTTGPDGNLWALETTANNVAKISVSGALLNEYPVPTSASSLQSLTAGPDGAMWFTEYSANKIGRVTTNGSMKEYPIASQPEGLATGPDDKLWVASFGASEIQSIATTGVVALSAPMPNRATATVTGSDGNVWFSLKNGATSGNVGYINPSTSAMTLYTTGSARLITSGPDGNLWFTDNTNGEIGRVLVGCTVSCVTLYPGATSGPQGIQTGPDGNIWFTESGYNVGRFVL